MELGSLIASMVEVAVSDSDMWSVEEKQRTNGNSHWQPIKFKFVLYYLCRSKKNSYGMKLHKWKAIAQCLIHCCKYDD